MKVPVAVLVSGSGTNLQALLDVAARPDYPARIAVVVSNRRDAGALDRARAAGVPAVWISHRGKGRDAFERELVAVLREHQVAWVALAGFMRVLTGTFLEAFRGRILNIHPSLLPAFPGLDAQRQAFDHGVRIAGCTVHFVDDGTDTGPIIAQGAVPVLPDDDAETLRRRILAVEHRIYPMVLRMAVEGRLHVDGRKVRVDLHEGEQTWMWGG